MMQQWSIGLKDDVQRVVWFLISVLIEFGLYALILWCVRPNLFVWIVVGLILVARLWAKISNTHIIWLEQKAEKFINRKQYNEALSLFNSILRVSQKYWGKEHRKVIKTLHNIARCYIFLERYEEAAFICQKAWNMSQRFYERYHPIMITCLHKLAEVYQLQGRYEEAESFNQQAVAIEPHLYELSGGVLRQFYPLDEIMGSEEEEELRVELEKYIKIAEKRVSQRIYDDETQYFSWRSLEIAKFLYHDHHMLIALCLKNMGKISYAQEENKSAESFLLEALEMTQQMYVGDHILVVQILDLLSRNYEEMGQNDKAQSFYLQALEMERRLSAKQTVHNSEENPKVSDKSVEIVERDDNKDTFSILSSDMPTLIKEGRYEEVESRILQNLQVNSQDLATSLSQSFQLPSSNQNPPTAYVLLYNVGTENEGIHSLSSQEKNTILMFESSADANNFAQQLQEQNFPVPTVEEMEREEIIFFCKESGYDWELVKEGTNRTPPTNSAIIEQEDTTNQQRTQAYLNLINQLLSCNEGDQPRILQENQDLLDQGFIEEIMAVAQQFEEAGRENKIKTVSNFLKPLAQVLGLLDKKTATLNTLENYINFLKETFEKILENPNPQVIYPFWAQNIDKLDDNLIKVLEYWLKYTFSPVKTDEAKVIAWFIFHFGNLIQQFPLGNIATNWEIAIAGYQIALTIFSFEGFPVHWAMTQNNLAADYGNRIKGDKAENLEKAIFHCTEALKVRTLEAFPQQWADTQNNLAAAYRNRIRGEKAENLEKAIFHCTEALKVRTFEAFPQYWAMTQNNLAVAYGNRIKGDKAENLEKAISCCQKALKVYTFEAFPVDWAMTQHNLVIAYLNRIRGEKAENLEKAIFHCTEALKVRTLEAFPQQWAMTQNNLAFAYCYRIRGEKAENLEKAIFHYTEALKVRTLEAFPQQYAPSCQLLQITKQRPLNELTNLFAIQNPTQDLIFTDLEVNIISTLFNQKEIIAKDKAIKNTVTTHLKASESHCYHFSCHGGFNPNNPLESALFLAKKETLDLGEIFELNFKKSRLVVLSACETGLIDLKSISDEYIGLPAGFLFAGSPSVVSSLWTVSDLSTSFLMMKFYEILLDQNQQVSVPVALKTAQNWLRNLTVKEFEEKLSNPTFKEVLKELEQKLSFGDFFELEDAIAITCDKIKEMSAPEKPFQNPFYWAAFTATGI